jgi:hypothetical protein
MCYQLHHPGAGNCQCTLDPLNSTMRGALETREEEVLQALYRTIDQRSTGYFSLRILAHRFFAAIEIFMRASADIVRRPRLDVPFAPFSARIAVSIALNFRSNTIRSPLNNSIRFCDIHTPFSQRI